MCYYDQTRWSCGFWRWGQFRSQCNKESRLGETCGLKLVWETTYLEDRCRLCDDIAKKVRRIEKIDSDIARWASQGNRSATIERAMGDREELDTTLQRMYQQHREKVNGLM